MKKLTVVVPVKNEAKNVTPLIRRIHSALKKADIEYDIIVIDDHSIDNTFEILQNLSKKYPLFVYQKDGKPGKAYSILEGARRTNSKFIAMIDGDLQYPPELLPQMYNLAVIHGVSVGNRTKRHTNFLRQFASKAYRFAFGKLLMGMDTDVQSGIKVFRREIITHISERDVTPWTLDMPLLHTARELGYSTASVDMEFLERTNGQSHVKVLRASCEIGLRALNLRFSKRRIYQIEPEDDTMRGSGLAYKKKRYITHTKLSHHESALRTTTSAQKAAIFVVVLAILAGVIINPFATAIAFTAALSFIYFIDVLFSSFVLLKSLHFPPELVVSSERLNEIKDRTLPVYSVLCPLYKEAHILPQFVEAMEELDWPKDKLEVLLLLEEDDTKTINAAKEMKLPSHFKVVVVPHSLPKSKPKACNYGLSIAMGEYVVIYDAEDKPDPLQLKKVYLSFLKLGKKYGCIQCKLNYFNSTDNLLTRLFTAEYSLWFDVILPGLQSIEGIIPLGGTSNHFRRADLLSLNAWDPFNVTEDADLGMRLFKRGYKTAIVDSTTLEEANSRVWNWIRQRSRWIKGYFQTYLVHMRNPIELFRTFGVQALVFQLVIGMRMTFMLINPLLWLITISYFAAYKIVGPTIESLFPPLVFYMAGFALIVGNFMYIYNYMIGCAKKGHWGLIKFVFLIPLYWLITSFAAAMALWQLITKPHYWEKTNHGLNTKKSDVGVEKTAKKKAFLKNRALKFQAGVSWIRSLKNSKVSGAGVLIFASGLNSLFGFLYNAYLGRSLQAVDFGLLALMGSLIGIVNLPMGSLSGTVAYRSSYLLGKYEDAPLGFWKYIRKRSTMIGIVVSILWLASSPFLAHAFQSPSILPFVLTTPIWIFSFWAAVDRGFLTANFSFYTLSLAVAGESFIKFALTILFINTNQVWLLYTAIPLSMILPLYLCWFIAKKTKSQNKIEAKTNDYFPKKFFIVSMITGLAGIAFFSFDVLFAKHFLDPVSAGYYTLLALVGKMIFFVGQLFSQFIYPVVTRSEGANKDTRKAFYPLFLLSTLSVMVAYFVFGYFGHITVPLLLGEKSAAIVPFLSIFTLGLAIYTIGSLIVGYHLALRHYLFSVTGIVLALLQVVGLSLFHGNLVEFVDTMFVLSVIFLAMTLLLHVFYEEIVVIFWNLDDLAGLFRSLNGKKPIAPGNLRILIFNWRDSKHKWAGGAEAYVGEIAKKWTMEGHKVTLFCGNDGESKREEYINNVYIVRRGGFYTVYLWAALYYIFRFRRNYDVIIESENGIPFFTPLYSSKPKFLIVHHVHQDVFRENLVWPLAMIAMFLESVVMPFVYGNQTIVSVSESSKKDFNSFKFARKKVTEVINPGINLELFKKRKKTKEPTLLYIGRLKKYKNIDIVIKAFNEVLEKYPKAVLTIAGFGDESGSLKDLANELGISKSVHFAGKVSESKKLNLLSRSWICVQPSSFEGWGITVIEANASGTPVIASNVHGLVDSVVDGRTGLLVPPRNPKILAATIIDLLNDKRYLKELSQNAYNWSQSFSWDQTSSKLMGVMRKLNNYTNNTSQSIIVDEIE